MKILLTTLDVLDTLAGIALPFVVAYFAWEVYKYEKNNN